MKQNDEEFKPKKSIINRWGATLSENEVRSLLESTIEYMRKCGEVDVANRIESVMERFVNRYAPSRKPETCKGCKNLVISAFKTIDGYGGCDLSCAENGIRIISVTGDYNNDTTYDVPHWCPLDKDFFAITEEQYDTAKRTVTEYEKREKERKMKECLHKNTFKGRSKNSQPTFFYVECKDCGKELQTWVETI